MKRVFLNFYLFVVATILILQFCLIPIMDRVLTKVLDDTIQHYYQELTRGVFYVMFQDLEAVDEEKWPEVVAAWKPHFGFGIDIVIIGEKLNLPEEVLRHLREGQIVTRGDGDYFFKRIGSSGFALKLGSTDDIIGESQLDSKISTIALISTIVVLSVITLLWSIPFWRKLLRIRSAAQAFGRGDLSIRAKLSRHSALAPVSEAFNSMADRIQQLIDSHRELTRAVSHELRTPVSRVRFSLEMLADSKDADERKQHVDGMRRDMDELDNLISELLTYARFDGTPPQPKMEAYPLAPWLNEVVAYVEPELEKLDFALHNQLEDPLLEARFDPKHMGRAVSNLLRNAAKYAAGHVALTIERDADCVCLHVDDDGPGIPEGERGRIFEPFARLDDSRSRDSGGYGLGLAIVERVALWHQGKNQVADSPLGGARFSICWPGLSEKPDQKEDQGKSPKR